ncbi:MAG: hypothetical protein JRI36_12455 [Deltaproteobacteria bacterium]|nr:hypothetical protein [Deltaproteobacteria bacterium]
MGSIQKFKTFEEADKALFCFTPDKSYYDRISQLWDFFDWICPRKYIRGVFRYRCIKDANRQAEEWLQDYINPNVA